MTIWIAYHPDLSEFSIFDTEIEAMRHAVQHSMSVRELALPAIWVAALIRMND